MASEVLVNVLFIEVVVFIVGTCNGIYSSCSDIIYNKNDINYKSFFSLLFCIFDSIVRVFVIDLCILDC